MADGPRVSMQGVSDEAWERIFGPPRRLGTPGTGEARVHPVRAEGVPGGRWDEEHIRHAMENTVGQMTEYGVPHERAEQIARDAAYRADARENGGTVRPYSHRPDLIPGRKEIP